MAVETTNPVKPSEEELRGKLTGLDREQAFMLYATFAGDVIRTAHALNVPPAALMLMADECGWNDKLRSIIEMKESSKPGDWERAVNRAINFVMAHQMRLLFDRALKRYRDMPEEELQKALVEEWFDKDGNKRWKHSGKVFADLAAAMEKVHSMTYHALSDTVQDRNRRKEQEKGEDSTTDMHAVISAKMNEISRDQSPRAQLFDAQLAKGQEIASEAREQVELQSSRLKKVRPKWKQAVEEAKNSFSEDPRMLQKQKSGQNSPKSA